MIRQATRDDWPSISDVSKRSGYEDYINEIGPSYVDDGEVLLYCDPGVKAFAKIEYLSDQSAWFSGLRVDPDYWREGIGTSLTEECVKWVKEKGYRTVRMLVYGDNFRSLKLVEKQGFRKAAKFAFYDGIPEISEYERNDIEVTEGYVNIGWKFIRATEGTRQKLCSYSRAGWNFITPDEQTFQILSAGSGLITLVGGGFTCMESSAGKAPQLSEKQFATGFVLEKVLK